MKTYKVKTQRNFKVGTILTGKLSQFCDGMRLVVATANGCPVRHGMLTEKVEALETV